MNEPIPADRRTVKHAAWAIVLLTLVQLCWLQWRPGSEFRQICAAAGHPSARPDDPYDQIARQAGDGNVLLKLAGYAQTNVAVENSLGYFYYRTAYALYPVRLYAAPADTVINDGEDIMRAGFNPSRQWLQAHDVRSVLTFGNGHAGGQTPHLEVLTFEDGQAAAPTNSPGGNR